MCTTTAACRYVVAVLALTFCSDASAQLLYSFETGLDGFEPQGAADSDYISHVQSTIGATDGTMALQIETGSGFGRDVVVNETLADGGPRYDLFNTVAADPANFTLDFDVTFTQAGWDRVADPGGFFQINVFSNSDSPQGFQESFGVVNGVPGSPSTATGSVPASAISLIPDSEFFQLGFGTNGNHTAGTNGEGVYYYVDNVRFTPAPVFTEDLLFSWETPDDPGTPAVNEQLEGWVDGFGDQPYFHTRTITTDGATEGASGLNFNSPQAGFSWASQFFLDSSIETGDPANQAEIDDLVDRVNDADRIAFDVTFPNAQTFPNFPTFLSLFVNISDSSGTFYQTPAKQAGNPQTGAGTTQTIEIPLSEFSAGGVSLPDAGGLIDGSTFFRIALATNSDAANDFILDNIRLLSEESDVVPGDTDGDGDVDLLDLDTLGANFGVTGATGGASIGDFDEDGDVDLLDLDTLGANFGTGTSAASTVPEPTTAGLLACVAVLLARGTRVRQPA